eukprot:4078999-Pleurochrysis_carterae.AAC.1
MPLLMPTPLPRPPRRSSETRRLLMARNYCKSELELAKKEFANILYHVAGFDDELFYSDPANEYHWTTEVSSGEPPAPFLYFQLHTPSAIYAWPEKSASAVGGASGQAARSQAAASDERASSPQAV